MTAGAGAGLSGNLVVVESDLKPIGEAGVARVARVARGHVVGPFTTGNDIVVTVGTRFTGLVVGKRQYEFIPARARGMA